MPQHEIKTFKSFACPGEFKLTKEEGADKLTLRGYAAVFDLLSEDRGGYNIRIKPGAFAAVLAAGPDCRVLLNHDPNCVLGRTTNGTLRLSEDARGLFCEIDLPDTTLGRDTAENVRCGNISQMSFSCRVDNPSWLMENKREICEFTEISRLLDVSPVTYSAFEQTSIGMRFGSTSGGLNISLIFNALLKAEAKDELSDEEVAEATKAVELLSGCIPHGQTVADLQKQLDALRG